MDEKSKRMTNGGVRSVSRTDTPDYYWVVRRTEYLHFPHNFLEVVM